MAFLYGELHQEEQGTLASHLESCAECQSKVASWQNAMRCLPKWKLPVRKRHWPIELGQPLLKWGLAALLVLGLGFGIGRVSVVRTDAKTVRAFVEESVKSSLVAEARRQAQAEVQADWQAALSGGAEALNTEFRRQLRAGLDRWAIQTVTAANAENQRVLTEFVDCYQASRQEDREMLLTLLDRAEQKHFAEHLSLRRAVETVAVVAADKFQRTETQLGQLASYAQARLISDSSDEPFAPLNPSNSKGN